MIVELSAAAVADLDELIETRSLPEDTRGRVVRSLRILETFPRAGRRLTGRWQPYRVLLGPWRWMPLHRAAARADGSEDLFHVAKLETTWYGAQMLKGQDILVLLELARGGRDRTVRSLGAAIQLDPAGVHRALQRLEEVRLIDANRRRVNGANAEEFLVHGLKYLFPVRQRGATRGVPTAWAAAPLNDELAPVDELPPVWPDSHGEVRGIGLEPLHENVPALARRDPELAQELALIDAIRIGDGRVRSLATKRLTERLRASAGSR